MAKPRATGYLYFTSPLHHPLWIDSSLAKRNKLLRFTRSQEERFINQQTPRNAKKREVKRLHRPMFELFVRSPVRKRGALELSITGIVVLIIAISLLAFALVFIKQLFGGAQEILAGGLARVKEDINKQIEESGEVVTIDLGRNLENVKKGRRYSINIGIKNDVRSIGEAAAEESVCYWLGVRCLTSFSEPSRCGNEDITVPAWVGGYNLETGSRNLQSNWFRKLLAEVSIENAGIAVLPVEFQIPANVAKDTYQLELIVYRASEEVDRAPCYFPIVDAEKGTTNGIPVGKFRFTIEVT